ncbi:MAG: GNAT family N-acetyltransferase [Candidatus Marinimicrobia bacterium]|nr:GNAT family N-acetyltransferase [Candidatus Neomarinimicrobiota bacterium]MDD5583414.1 GNAT family N-acetyltransferase [Candidatus Neomarinimicrobiota bacterium]
MMIRRGIHPSDLAQIEIILASSGLFHDYEIAIAVEIGKEVLSKGEESGYTFLFLEEKENTPLGFAVFGPVPCTHKRFDLYWIGVHKMYQRKGYGKKLLKACESLIQESEGEIIYIETSSRKDYLPTQEFYLKNGYHLETIIHDFYEDGDGKYIFSKRI